MCQSYLKYPPLLYRTVQSQSSVRYHWPLWPKHRAKILYWHWLSSYVHKRNKPKCSAISKIRCKAVQRYLLQFDLLEMQIGMLHWLYIAYDVEAHQLVFPKNTNKLCFRCYMMNMVIRDWTTHWL